MFFITGRRQEALDEAVKLIGRNVTGVRLKGEVMGKLEGKVAVITGGSSGRFAGLSDSRHAAVDGQLHPIHEARIV